MDFNFNIGKPLPNTFLDNPSGEVRSSIGPMFDRF